MHPIVQLTQLGELRASSEAIAQGFKLQHKNVLELVRRHLLRLEVFGKVAFETRLNRRGSATETALLNEQQASLLIAMIGAIVLTLRHRAGVKRQDINVQNARTPEMAMSVRQVASGQGLQDADQAEWVK